MMISRVQSDENWPKRAEGRVAGDRVPTGGGVWEVAVPSPEKRFFLIFK